MEVRKISEEHIQKYRSDILRSSSASTFDRKIFSLKKFFEWAVKEGYIDESPVEQFLKNEQNVIEQSLGKIEKQRKLTTPSYSSIQSRIIAKFAGKPKLQKLVYNLFYKRPQWYLTYHNLPIASYFNYAILFLLMSAVGYGAYNQFFKRTSEPLAYPTALTAPSRFLSFQGRLTDKNGNPITAVTDLEFKLYNASESGTLLWDSGVCSISPDPDGIFSTLLGSSCGSEIASSVFSENSAVWLGATVGADTEATPRVQIATVAYALNSETLQGFPASMSATAYTIPAINSSGYLVLGSSSPKLQSTSGTFAIEGQALTITTPNTSNGSIAINPDGTGTLNLTFEGAAPGGSAQGFVNATNANLTSQALYYGEVANDATGYNLLELASGTTPRTKFAIDSGGNATLSGTINGLAISGGTVTTGVWNGTAIGTQYGGTGADWHTVVQGSIPYFSGTGAMSTLAPDTSGYVLMTQGTSANPKWANAATLGTNYWQLANHVLSPANHADYDLAVGGTSTASAKFQVFAANGNLTTAGTASVSGNLTLGNGSALQSAYGPLTLNYKSGANAYTAGLSLTNSGYVGIGKTDPGYLLDVNGNARTTGTLYVDALVDKDYSGNSITFPSVLNVKIGGGYGLNVSSETVGTRLNLSGGDTGPTSAVTKIDMTGNTVSTSHPNYAYQWIGINHALTLNLQGTLGSNNQDVSIFKSVITTTNDLVGGKRLFLEFSKDSANKFLVDFSGNLYAAGYATASASLALGNTTARTGPGNLNASGRITGVEIYQGANQVCDSSGAGCPASMGLNYWQLSNHVLAPANYTDYDLAVGGTATSSAKFQVLASNGNLTTAGTASVSGNLTLGNGSAIQSAYGPVTLNYKSGADAYTAGLSLTNSGYVGIGTTNPSQKLQVKGNVLIGDSAAGNANITGDDNPTINLNWITDERVGITSNANAKWTGGGTLLGAIRFGSGSSYALIGNTGATTNLLLNPYAGNVGIGTISPTALLDVAGAASASGSLSFRIGAATVGATGMSDLTLGSSTTGNVVINSRGSTALTANGADLTAGGNANLTASTNLIFGGTTSLGETTSPTDSGAYMVGANDEFTYATSTNVQGVLKEFDTKLGTLSSSNYWSVLSNNTIYPTTTVEDLLLGSSATSSAKFAFTGVGSGVPNILINNASVLNATTLGTSVVTSSLTTVGALASGSIANGFGTIATSNTITGTTINGTTGINTGATAGTQRIDASGNLVNIANISASGYATVSASLALGNTNAAVGPGHLDMSGNLNVMGNTTLGDATTDTITFTGRVAQDADLIPIGTTGTNDLGASTLPWDNIYLASAGSLFLDSDTALSDTGLNDAGAYSVGTYDEFTYSSSTNVQDVLHDLDTQLGTVGTNYWRLSGNVLAPTQIAYDLVVGGSATGSAFQVFAQTGNVTLADLVITGGNINPSAALTIGDNGDTLTLDSSDWDIGATGDMTGIGAITADGTISFTGTTIGLGTSNSATAINIGSGTGGNTINIAGTGATGADTVNIGTGATGADAVNIGSANAGAVTIRSNAALGLTGSTGSFLTFPNFAVDTNGIITKIDNVAHTIDDVSGNLTLTSNSNTISLNDNTSVVGYATASASLALGNTNAAVGPGHLNMSGNLTLAGLIDANGTGTHDIAGTLNLSGNALSSTGDLSIDAGGGDINLGSGDNLNLTASTDLFFGTTSLGETTSNTDSGAYIVGVNDEFTYATATNVQGVLKEFDTKLGTLSSSDYWSVLSNNTIYPTTTIEDLLLGSSATSSAKFAFTGVGSGVPNILINNASVLNATTLGTSVVTSSLTTVGALASGSIATGFGTITTANTITGTTINGTTGINTGATAGTQRIDANGNLVNILNISATGNATISGVLTLGQAFKPGGSAGTAGQVLTSAGGYNAPTWTDLPAAGTNYWQYNSNVLAPGNTTFDVAIGGNATSSSKFQVMGTTGNIYTANNTVDWTLNNAADALNFDANTLSIDALNNRVGIGTTNPGAKLEAMVAQDNYIFDLTNGTETEFKLRTYNDGTTVTNANAFTQGLYYTNQENAAIHYYRGGTSLGGWLTFTTNNGSERMRIDASGNVGIGTTNPTQKLDVNGNFNLTGYATMSASLALGNTTAVAGPGNLRMSGDATISGVLSLGQAFKPGNDAGTSGYLLTSAGGGVNTWTNPATLGTNYWSVLSNNTIYPTNTLEDLLLGSSATASAKFAFTGVGSGTPNILINNASVLNATTLGTSVVTSSLTTVGALANGSIANGFGTIATANTITGTTINGTTGINTGATAGTQRIDASGNLVNIANISASGYATVSASLALGNTTAAKGPGHLNMSGDLTIGGLIDANGTGTHDIAGTLNLSGNSLTSSGDLTIDAAGGDVNLGASDNLGITAATNLIFGGTTSLGETTSPTDSGAYMVGANDEFTYSTHTTVQGVLKDFDTQLGTLGSASVNFWQLASNVLAPINVTNDLTIGGNSTSSAKFQVLGTSGNITTAGSASVSGNLTLGYGSALQSAYGPLTLNYKSGANAYTAGLTLTNSGYVGIGTTSPSYKLDISGNGRLTAGLVVGGTLTGTSLVSDTFSRSDGAIGITETGQKWSDSTWTVSSNKAINTPTTSSDIMTNGGFEAPFTGGLANGWSLSGSPTPTQETSIKHSGSSSQKLTSNNYWNGVTQSPSFTVGTWYRARYYLYPVSGGNHGSNLQIWDGVVFWADKAGTLTNDTWNEVNATGRARGTGGYARWLETYPSVVDYIDDFTITPLTLRSLFSSVSSGTADYDASVNVTLSSGTQVGLVLNLDSTSSPSNFVLAYHDGGKAYLEKVVNGTYTTLINSSVTYSAGAAIRVVKSGTTYQLFYNGSQVGTDQTISDSAIVNNTLHGLFSTYSGNTLDNFSITGSGTSGNLFAVNSNGQVYTSTASASLPAYSFNDDIDTGIFSSGLNTLNFSTGGSERLRIDLNGNVGIGTANPSQKLDVNGNFNLTGYATMSASLALGNTTAAKGPGHLNMSGDLRVGGNVYLGNNQIMNSGDVNLIALTSNPQLTPSYLYASWAVSNGAAGNPGLASLLVDQTKSGDLFTASASGTPKFTINTSGNIAATGTITGLTGITSSGTINFSGLTASRALFTDASSNLSSTGTSAMIANAISDETGSAGLVFQNQPGFTGYISTPIVYGSIVTTNGLTLAGNNWTGNTATAANITFKVGDSAGTTAMTILNNANVGIGTTGPTTLLGVAGTASISGTLTLGNGSSNAIQSAYGPLTLNYKSGADAWTAGLSLTNSGYVGIGTATPNTTLDVLGTITAQSTSGRGMIDLFKNTTANQTGGFGIGRITFSNLVNLAYQTESSPLGNITVVHDASGATNSYPTRMEFAVTPSGEATASTQMTLDSTGYLGIGVSAPAEELDIAGQIQFDLDGTTDTTIGVCKDVADGTGVESNVEFRDCSTTPGDIAEYYAAEADLRPGDVVAIATVNGKPTLVRTSGANQQNIFGVVSTYPVGQFGKPLSGDTISADEFPTAIALTGKLPVKVSLEGGPIVAGDALTSSSIPGVAMKANKSGKIIGYAVEPYNGSIIVSSEVRKQEIMRSEAIVKFNQDPVDPTEEGVGKILMAAGTSWFDSGIYLADNGNLNIVSGNNGEYKLTDSTDNNSVVENVGAFAKASIANIKAGLINTIDIVASGSIQAANFIAENINTGAATIGDLTTNTFTAFQGTVDNLLVKSGLVAGNIQTAMISPIPGEQDVRVEVGDGESGGKLIVQNTDKTEVASIDSSGNATFAGTINSQQLTIDNEATIGGTLYADNIKSKSLDDIEALLTQVQTDQNLLKEANNWSVLTSTNSANLDQLVLTDLYVTNQAAINSLSVTNYLSLGNDFVIQTDLGVNGEMLATSINTLASPLKIQSLAMAPVEIMAGLIKIDTSGNVQIAGNLAVAGKIESSSLNLVARNEATTSANLLSLQDSNGNMVSYVNSSGSATFNNVLTQGLTIAGATAEATTSAIVDGVITSNATAGSAIIPAGSSEITIKNNNVTDYTLVYVTPTSTTNNYVLYVKSKGQGQFVVGFTNAIDVDVNFNWWIVKVSQ